MPRFHYEAEGWGVQLVVDSEAFAERHPPFLRGSPVKAKPSQANGRLGTQGSLPAKCEGGGGAGREEKSGVSHLFQKIRRHQIFTKRQRETGFQLSRCGQGRQGLCLPTGKPCVRFRRGLFTGLPRGPPLLRGPDGNLRLVRLPQREGRARQRAGSAGRRRRAGTPPHR